MIVGNFIPLVAHLKKYSMMVCCEKKWKLLIKRNDFGAPGDYAKRYVLISMINKSHLEVILLLFLIFEIEGLIGWD